MFLHNGYGVVTSASTMLIIGEDLCFVSGGVLCAMDKTGCCEIWNDSGGLGNILSMMSTDGASPKAPQPPRHSFPTSDPRDGQPRQEARFFTRLHLVVLSRVRCRTDTSLIACGRMLWTRLVLRPPTTTQSIHRHAHYTSPPTLWLEFDQAVAVKRVEIGIQTPPSSRDVCKRSDRGV